MLRLIKKHLAACCKTSERDWKCRTKDGTSKIACPFYIAGPDPTNTSGARIKKHTGTASEQTARAVLHEFERSLFDPTPKLVKESNHTLAEILGLYLTTKKHKSTDRQRRLRQQLSEMTESLRADFGHQRVTDVRKTDLERFMFSWKGSYSTLSTRRENLKGFRKYCHDSDFTRKNIASAETQNTNEKVAASGQLGI